MQQQNGFEGLRFDRHIPAIPAPLVLTLGTLALFTLAWLVLPDSLLYVLLALTLSALVWAASFGWREALGRLIALLQRLHRGQ